MYIARDWVPTSIQLVILVTELLSVTSFDYKFIINNYQLKIIIIIMQFNNDSICDIILKKQVINCLLIQKKKEKRKGLC